MRHSLYSTDPAEFEIRPGRRVASLSTVAECEQAVRQLDDERATILEQIDMHEADRGRRSAGWRASAQAALRWKRRVRTAVNARANNLRKTTPNAHARRKAILAVVFDEVGEPEFRRLVQLTKGKHPHLFAEEASAG